MDFKRKAVLLGAVLLAFNIQAKETTVKKTLEYVPNELIVKFKNNSQMSAQTMGLPQVEEVTQFRASGAKLLRFPKIVDVKNIMNNLLMSDEIEYVEPNYIYYLDSMPNDPDFEKLYGLNNEGKTGGVNDADIDAPEAWDISIGSHDILVGVIDTGADYSHEDLKDNMWINPGESGVDASGNNKSTNGIDDDNNGYIDDFHGWDFINSDNDPMDGHSHGTHVSGTIGAVGDNGTGVAGINWHASIVPIKIFSDSGSTTADAIVKAIEYSTKLGVRVTNNSWGGGGYNKAIEDAISEANDNGILFIAAAGNSRSNNDNSDYYPANYDLENIISVAATDNKDALASFSSYGKNTVDIAAPGVDIYSTKPGNRYGAMSGTSMATPHVTGLAALVMSQYPDASMEEIRSRIVNTGDKAPGLADKIISGARINALNALENDTVPPNAPANLVIDEASLKSITLSWDTSGDDGASGQAASYEIRISDQPISDDNFEEATAVQASMEMKQEGRMFAVIAGLPINTSGYVAMRAIDNIGNTSSVSESMHYQTRETQILFENLGDSLQGFTADQPWGVEQVEGNSVLTDSPKGPYRDSVNISLTSTAISAEGSYFAISFDHTYTLEKGYDFGRLELSVDGGPWDALELFTGEAGWGSVYVDISSRLQGASSFQFRFRLQSDSSTTMTGWQIDNVTVLTTN